MPSPAASTSVEASDDTKNSSITSIIRSQFKFFTEDCTPAPRIARGPHRSIGIDNSQRSQYRLEDVRAYFGIADKPLIQVVGDSGTPFDIERIPKAKTVLSSHVAGCAIEYGFTASRYDANWLVNDYHVYHPETFLIANVVDQAVEVLESGMKGYQGASMYVILFDRLSPTRFGHDVWLSDGVMDRKHGDKMLCLEGGPQALYQCCNALLAGISVVAVSGLRENRFSAARFLQAFSTGPKHAEDYLGILQLTPKQSNISRWCLSRLQESEVDIALLVDSVDAGPST